MLDIDLILAVVPVSARHTHFAQRWNPSPCHHRRCSIAQVSISRIRSNPSPSPREVKLESFKPWGNRWSPEEPHATCSTKCPTEAPRVFAVSDLHTDYAENMGWVMGISEKRFQGDVLLVAGDVAETYGNFVATMSALRERFGRVFFVPGNHDLWCRREGGRFLNSLEKLNALLDACGELGVETKPAILDGGLGIIPLFSWYHESFDKEKDVVDHPIPPLEMVINSL